MFKEPVFSEDADAEFCLSAGALLEQDMATTANMSISDLAQSASFFIVIC